MLKPCMRYALIALCLTFIVTTCLGQVLDQSYTSGSAPHNAGCLIGEGFQYIGMSYTAGVSGALAGINLDIFAVRPAQLHIAIHDFENGYPTSSILGETTLSSSGTNLSDLITFPTTISQVAGEIYVIVADYQTPSGAGLAKGTWRASMPPTYSDGEAYVSNDAASWGQESIPYDLFFQTYVNPIPEPSTFSLLGIGITGLLVCARRQRK